MRKKLTSVMALGISALLAVNGLYAASMEDRVETAEGNLELMEEAINDLRHELDNRMRVSGYVDVEYVIDDGTDKGFRMHHMSIFFQKKISDKWKFFSETEYEDTPKFEGTTAEGKIFVEAVNLDYTWKPEAIFRFGRFFTPAGIWSVDHYPPFVPTQERPGHIRKIFPQLVDGAMAYGTFAIGKHYLSYNAYYVNGEGNTGAKDKNEDRAMGLKVSANIAVPKLSLLEVGGTFYADPKDSANKDAEKTAMGGHLKAKMSDFILQSEAAYAKFSGGTAQVNTKAGYYFQAMYEPSVWGVGVRHDLYSDKWDSQKTTTNSLFVNYRFNPNLVVKIEHHLIDKDGTDTDKTILSVVSYLE